MPWKLLAAQENFTDYASQWDFLNKKFFDAHPLLDSRFVSNLVNYFALPSTQLAIYEDEEKNIDSMILVETIKYGKCSVFSPGQAPIAPVLISSYKVLEELFSVLPTSCCLIDVLCQDVDYTNLSDISYKNIEITNYWNTINIDIAGNTFDDYWSSRSRKLRNNVKRYLKRVSNDFEEFEFKTTPSREKVKQSVIDYGDLESRGWKGKMGTALHKNNVQGKFYQEVLCGFSEPCQTKTYELYINDKLVASRLAVFGKDNILVMLKTTYDEGYSSYSPGRVLLFLVIEHEFKLGQISKIEFYTNATIDQKSWATGSRKINHITLFRNSFSKFIILLLKRFQHVVRKQLKNSAGNDND